MIQVLCDVYLQQGSRIHGFIEMENKNSAKEFIIRKKNELMSESPLAEKWFQFGNMVVERKICVGARFRISDIEPEEGLHYGHG